MPRRRPGDARLWMQLLARYRQPSTRRGLVEIVLTLVPLVALWVLTWVALDLGYWLALPLARPPPASWCGCS